MHFERAVRILNESLVGNGYTHISVGDWWCFAFQRDLWIVAQDVVFPEEPELSQLLANARPPVLDSVDPENVTKGVLVLRNMRWQVTDVSLASDATLCLSFGDRQMCFTTDADVVDWQWCLNRSGADPYHDFVVACFWAGEVEVLGD
jgi:hypothetical protein